MSGRIGRASIAAVLAALVVACADPAASPAAPKVAPATVPRSFFGIVPQSSLSAEDAEYMRAGGIGSVRMGIGWDSVQATRGGPFDWERIDREVAMATSYGLRVLPFLSGVPSWVSSAGTTLPIDSAEAREEWKAFVGAAVRRYGPGGEFWAEHSPGVAKDGIAINKPLPIRTWQIWNEVNFFYFAFPVSPIRYARLLKPSYNAIKSLDPGAKVVLSGLFGEPKERGPSGMPAAEFLARLYRVPRISHYFDAVALHPYAFHVEDLEAMVEGVRAVMLENEDAEAGLYITEMGWGSQNDPDVVAFEQGIAGQARELRGAYRYLLANRLWLNLQGAFWFTWKDSSLYCSFCDSVGLFGEGSGYLAKPAWRAFVRISGGRPQP
jgi:hypothetical protein